jgi:hypothetical protein
VYYLGQHYKYLPDAQHFLVIGPYDHLMAQRGTTTVDGDVDRLAGYKLDPAALIDLIELRFRWFDHVLKGAPMPALLTDKINYQVTGANLWKHAPTLAAMANSSARYYLSPGSTSPHRLTEGMTTNGATHLTIDLADRRDVDVEAPGGDIQDKLLDSSNGLVYISEPLRGSIEASGLFSAHLEFMTNKSDFDFQVALYELTAGKEYIQLARYWSRASYVENSGERRLLVPEKRQSLDFKSLRLMSRQLEMGSRLVAVLSVVKEPGREINYGTGKIVSEESIADAKVPLKITWFPSSYVDLPVRK